MEADKVRELWFIDDVGGEMSQSDLGRRFAMQYQAATGTVVSKYAVLGAEAYFRVLTAIARTGQCHSTSIGESLASTFHYPGIRSRMGSRVNGIILLPRGFIKPSTGGDHNLSSAIPTVSSAGTR